MNIMCMIKTNTAKASRGKTYFGSYDEGGFAGCAKDEEAERNHIVLWHNMIIMLFGCFANNDVIKNLLLKYFILHKCEHFEFLLFAP